MHIVNIFYAFLTHTFALAVAWSALGSPVSRGSPRSGQRARNERGGSEEEAGRVFRWVPWSGRSALSLAAAAQRSSSAVLLCLCPCAPSRLAPCRLRGAVSPAVLAPARFAACRHPRFALARLRAFALAVPASVRQNGQWLCACVPAVPP